MNLWLLAILEYGLYIAFLVLFLLTAARGPLSRKANEWMFKILRKKEKRAKRSLEKNNESS
ncbi:hypothetical protein AKJ65_02070 [candidate division MSBL1 archaeon SCGC-AAA259E19]|uniref:Uncharacterized protein n=1 Tax=candidate division MSBL1 archaeon SCGC-AAA259E19 TaxID=1698264 RepID=A0A133UM74_9EURY|nr:hypothetical protein AKJ65_02070 [candidate division MSBL1 archaeon SCGC-AAA259E19]